MSCFDISLDQFLFAFRGMFCDSRKRMIIAMTRGASSMTIGLITMHRARPEILNFIGGRLD